MESHDRDQFDDLLDGALRQYGDVEPRAGLEGRVLARLRAESVIAPRKRIWAAAFVACACMLAAIGVGWQHHSHKPAGIAAHRTQVPPATDRRVEIASSAFTTPQPLRETQARASGKKNSTSGMTKATPRLSQFPSPRPLSEQERLLKAYVTNFPQGAALIAREQAQRQKELAALGWNETDLDSN